MDAFRPGSSAVNEIPSAHAQMLAIKGGSANSSQEESGDMDFCPVRVQAFYGRSPTLKQLRYVQVQETPAQTVPTSYTNDYERFGIPGNVHSAPTSHTVSADRRDLNLSGKYFFAYKLLESLDLAELILEDSRVGTSPGFQVVLTKLMEDDDKRFGSTLSTDAELTAIYTIFPARFKSSKPWKITPLSGAKFLDLSLTQQQTNSAEELLEALDELYTNALKKGVELSSHTLRHEYGITNKVDPDTEASRASSYIVPRAINLLAFRANGTFLNYPQITHIAAAIRYVLRSIMLYNLMAEGDNDDEAAVGQRYCSVLITEPVVSVCILCPVTSCSSYGSHSQLPTITWATDDFTALRLISGALLTVGR
ncbi:hypothetical protein V1508DRAFT_400776 [Lipomyces doorenjongii]|uniref:uncharacterized protein n=1 Tax=Lipomyces doorenjongii TaxID=383834 RepID=UPI0034CEC470